MKLTVNNKLSMLMLALLIGMVSSCGGSDSPSTPDKSAKAEWQSSSSVSADEVKSAIILKGAAGTSWSATISEGSDYSSFESNRFISSSQGKLTEGENIIYLYCKANKSGKERRVVIEFKFGATAPQQLTLTQNSVGSQPMPSSLVWPELPAEKSEAGWQYTTHYVTLNGTKLRNYSLCFDSSKKAALWVAYPLHTIYDGKLDRSGAWAFDPTISNSSQPDCTRYSYKGNYDRGHQIPSADRLANFEMNAQTFYMSNLTPQLDRLNQDMWAKLETRVRNNRCSDTLYVVTGAYFGPDSKTTADGSGVTVPIPTHYYKVLLRTKSGNTGKSIAQCSDSELISIGFWVEHKSYGNIEPTSEICTTVADIESKTGFTFFPTVSSAVKSQNTPSVWGIKN